jgi:hypothetical protein
MSFIVLDHANAHDLINKSEMLELIRELIQHRYFLFSEA